MNSRIQEQRITALSLSLSLSLFLSLGWLTTFLSTDERFRTRVIPVYVILSQDANNPSPTALYVVSRLHRLARRIDAFEFHRFFVHTSNAKTIAFGSSSLEMPSLTLVSDARGRLPQAGQWSRRVN